MLTSFFGKSSPINYLLLSLYLSVVLIVQAIFSFPVEWKITLVLELLLTGALLIFSMLLVDFIVRKNALAQSNTFAIFCFSTIIVLFPVAFSWKVLTSLFLILLGLRRILSLHSGKNDVKKIVDASLWIFLASYFYFWNILWFAPLYLAISSMKEVRFRYYFIPMITGIGLLLILSAYFMISEDSFQWMERWAHSLSLRFYAYGQTGLLVAITVVLAFFVWSFFYRLLMVPEIPKKWKSNFILVFVVSVVGIMVALVAPQKTGAELSLLAPGVALVITSYLERASDRWLQEIMMWVLLLLPLALPFL